MLSAPLGRSSVGSLDVPDRFCRLEAPAQKSQEQRRTQGTCPDRLTPELSGFLPLERCHQVNGLSAGFP